MPAPIIEIADALVTALNGHTFTPTFAAVRAYIPVFSLEDLTALTVRVIPAAQLVENLDRTRVERRPDIIVDIRQKLTTDMTNAEVDPLMALVDDMLEFLKRQSIDLTGGGRAVCSSLSSAPVYSHEDMYEARLFASQILMTFKAFR